MTVLHLLLPGSADVGDLTLDRDSAVQALADLYAYPDPLPARGWVRANMVSTLDGSGVGPDGRTGSINGPADRETFAVLRGLADVVLVGAGTVRAEKYGPPDADDRFADRRLRSGQTPAACLAIVTRSGEGLSREMFTGENPSLLVTTADADLPALRALAGPDRVIVAGGSEHDGAEHEGEEHDGDNAGREHGGGAEHTGNEHGGAEHSGGELDIADAVQVLASLGLRRVLLEGGPNLLAQTLAAGRVDELCLTWSPMLVGGEGPRISHGAAYLHQARLAHLIHADGLLLGRWLVHDQPND